MAIINGSNFNDNNTVNGIPAILRPTLTGVVDLFIDLADTINGLDGNDIIIALGTNDTLNGGNGNDQLFGGDGNDALNGGAGNDSLDGGSGNDTMTGGTGNDFYVVDRVDDNVIEAFAEGTDTVSASVSYSLSANVENLTLAGTAVNGYGNNLNNTINGNAIANSLYGYDGNDTIRGYDGNDYLSGGIGATSGNDSLYGGNGNDTIYGWDGNDYLSGDSGNDILDGGAGNDTLNGGSGNDTMAGDVGNDSYVVNSSGDVVTEGINAGMDSVSSSVNYVLGANLENLSLTGTAANGYGNSLNNVISGNSSSNLLAGNDGNDTIYGNDGNDLIYGGNGNDAIYGGNGNDGLSGEAGDDFMDGGAGNDVLNGGLGNDTMVGGTGDDFYVVDAFGDVVTELVGGGIDSVSSSISYTLTDNVENLYLSGIAVSGYGNALDNTIVGTTGNNSLFGLDGADILNGGSGNDYLAGGSGNDTINGEAGNDTLIGGNGADLLTGGEGVDTFDFNATGESSGALVLDLGGNFSFLRDRITDFNGNGILVGDRIDVSTIDANTLLAGNQAFVFIGPGNFSGAGQIRYSNGLLQANVDANLGFDFAVVLDGAPSLVASDIVL